MLHFAARAGAVLALLGAAAAPASADPVALRPDGAALVATRVTDAEHSRDVLAAIMPDGSVDASFGLGGTVRGRVGGGVAVPSDGSVHGLVLRHFGCGAGSPHSCQAQSLHTRYDDDGAFAGVTELALEYGADSPRGALTASGATLLQIDDVMPPGGLRRLGADGEKLDETGLPDGALPRVLASSGDGALVGGTNWVARFDGELEPVATFGGDGMAALPFDPAALAASGEATLAAGDDQVIRLRGDGSPDPDFAGGSAVTVPAAGRGLRIAALRPLPGGDFLVGGSTTDADPDFVVVRMREDGSADPGFGTAGVRTIDFSDREDELEGLAVTPSGDVLATGGSRAASGPADRRVAVTRLTGGGGIDASFGDGGRSLTAFDARPPEVEVTEPAPGASQLDVQDLHVAASSPEAGATLQCAVWKQFKPCTDAPAVFEDVEHGRTEIEVVASDAHGNTRGIRREVVIVPRTVPLAGPAAYERTGSATFAWESGSGSEGTFECRLDGGAWTDCASPRTVSGLGDGAHTFEVRQSALRLVEPTPARWEWTVDTRPPVTSLRGGSMPGRDAVIEFAVDDPAARSECRLDGGPWLPCASPVRYSGLADGMHTVEIVSIDPAGNREERGTSATWKVDPPPQGGGPPTPPPPRPAEPTLAERRAAAAAGLRLATARGRARRGVSLRVTSAVAATVRVTGTVAVGGKRRALRAFSGRVAAGASVGARLKPGKRALRALRRTRARRVSLRLRVVLRDASGVRLATRKVTVQVRR